MATIALKRPTATADKPRNGTPVPSAVKRLTFAEYMEIEHKSETRHDLVEGVMIPVSGGTGFHNRICGNIIRALGNELEETDCAVHTSDQNVYIGYRRGCYPDVVVVCGERDMAFGEALKNPVMLVEVLSESTALTDYSAKFREYRSIGSVRHYVLIDRYKPQVDYYERGENGEWLPVRTFTNLADTWRFFVNGKTIAIPLSEIYDLAAFDDAVGAF